MPFCPSVLSVLGTGSPVPVFLFFCHQIIMWHLFVPLVNQRLPRYSKHSSRGAFGDIFRLGPRTTNHELRKKGLFIFFYF